MEQEHYEDAGLWLRERILYLPDVEVSARASQKMKALEVYFPDILDVFKTGEVVAADRDYDGCHYIVRGRNCDGEEITVRGRFEAASMRVVIDDIM
jgi:hypothetical protein